jgi:hypothetical protein
MMNPLYSYSNKVLHSNPNPNIILKAKVRNFKIDPKTVISVITVSIIVIVILL